MKRVLAVSIAVILCASASPVPISAAPEESFYDDFSGTTLDTEKWLIAEKNWGGTIKENGKTVDYNGGVVAENVALKDNKLVFTGNGNQYEGSIRGINRDGSRRENGKRCGGAIATKAYYGSGSYEIRAKIAPELGCCSAMWTFEYEEDYSSDSLRITNHEIDIEFPGRNDNNEFSLSHALCTTWITETDYKTESVSCGEQTDDQFHTYRFDWHTGSETEKPRVEYYFDGELRYTAYDYIPTNESRFWLGLWFPKNWAGTPDFNTATFEIDYVRITPFHEDGDTPQHESYPDSGWTVPAADLPKGWLLWHSYSSYSALDSKLFLRDPNGSITEITGDFVHAMNGSFGRTPDQFTFMAIDRDTDEWDIFLSGSGNITNLTSHSNYRNEDPKFSPDGKSIVFKRGQWNNSLGDFVYDIALLDIASGKVTMLTSDSAEDAMPCFSPDGTYLYYTQYTEHIGSILRMNMKSRQTEVVFSEPGINAYYPITGGDLLYFTTWHSPDNHCDRIMCFDGESVTPLPFGSESFDCSDSCPVNEAAMIYSSTQNGSYDLYYYDGKSSVPLSELNSENQQLGADFYSYDEYEKVSAYAKPTGDVNDDGVFTVADIVLQQKWLLGDPNTTLVNWQAGDLRTDHRLDAADLCLMKQTLLKQHS